MLKIQLQYCVRSVPSCTPSRVRDYDSSATLLASIRNVDPVHLCQEGRGEWYSWLMPGESLPERRSRAEGRREELLHLLYEDKLNAEQVQELIREWMALVKERDKLLHEEMQKENQEEKEEYLRELRAFLDHIPLTEQSYEEKKLKDCLTMLEKQVNNYCKSHNIDTTKSRIPAWQSMPNGLECDSYHDVGPVMPDREPRSRLYARSVTPSFSVPASDVDGPGTAEATQHFLCPPTFHYAPASQASTEGYLPEISSHTFESDHPVSTNGAFHIEAEEENSVCEPESQSTTPACPISYSTSSPECRPPPPPPPPLPPLIFFAGAATAVGTGQFVRRGTESTQDFQTSSIGRRQSDSSLLQMDRGLFDQIVSTGQKNLRSTRRPRSPGGTPVRTLAKPAPFTGNDKLQQALLSKFKTLHLTPIKQQSAVNEHMDFSNQWSDVNSYEDPNFTTGNNTSDPMQDIPSNISQCFNPSPSKVSTPKPGKSGTSNAGSNSSAGWKRNGKNIGKPKLLKGVSPNASRKSTAV